MEYLQNGILISCDENELDPNKRICVLTYQTLHRKTLDTLMGLRCAGYKNVCTYAAPMQYVKSYQPFIEHRPELYLVNDEIKENYQEIITRIGYACRKINAYEEIDEPDSAVFLVCGAGVLSQDFVKRYCIINAHPGYLPMVRGLDALKWAVLEHCPIGVTTHLLGDFVDAGKILERREVPIMPWDTFHTVANRQYQIEIQMLVGAIEKADKIELFTDGENYPIHRRMPHEIEKTLLAEFEKYKLDNTVQNKED